MKCDRGYFFKGICWMVDYLKQHIFVCRALSATRNLQEKLELLNGAQRRALSCTVRGCVEVPAAHTECESLSLMHLHFTINHVGGVESVNSQALLLWSHKSLNGVPQKYKSSYTNRDGPSTQKSFRSLEGIQLSTSTQAHSSWVVIVCHHQTSYTEWLLPVHMFCEFMQHSGGCQCQCFSFGILLVKL